MSVTSHSGRLYSMNVIDDYSGFVWSLPLRSKSEASIVLKHWLTAVENQTSHRLKCLVTDNGELSSLQIRDLCAERRILHLFTAPYTSAQNGHAERLHCTIMDCACATRISCNAPPDMWDEFVPQLPIYTISLAHPPIMVSLPTNSGIRKNPLFYTYMKSGVAPSPSLLLTTPRSFIVRSHASL